MFDPLAFLKPDIAFTFEGLLSQDMFEYLTAEDERRWKAISQDANVPHAQLTPDYDWSYEEET